MRLAGAKVQQKVKSEKGKRKNYSFSCAFFLWQAVFNPNRSLDQHFAFMSYWCPVTDAEGVASGF